MPTYEIEQYEICTTKYRVEATSEADAIMKLLAGEAAVVDNSHELIEVADQCGLSVDEHTDLADQLRDLGIPVGEIIPSIRSIEEVE